MGSSFADHSLVPHGVNASFHAAKRLSATANGSPAQTLLLALLLLQHHGNDSSSQGYRHEASAQGCTWSTRASQYSSLPKAVLSCPVTAASNGREGPAAFVGEWGKNEDCFSQETRSEGRTLIHRPPEKRCEPSLSIQARLDWEFRYVGEQKSSKPKR